ncbi:MAG: 4-phosphoerythronate dehydrogenase [Bacteroidales bacterium]|nr:4-phosphoerythronate dehydrogenase [Bacteroidales bacterium]
MKIVCDDRIPFIRGVFDPYAEVCCLAGEATTPDAVKDADAVVTRTRTICDGALLEGSRVRIVSSATIGYDHIDTRWCDAHRVVWRNAPGCNSGSVAQYIASAIVCLARKHGLDFAGMTLGIVGVGHVGSKVAKVGEAFGMKVLLCDPPRERREKTGGFVDLDTLIAGSDIITLHVPLEREGVDATYHLFGEERLGRMTSDQILINSSRGPVVDNVALKRLLGTGRLKGAVLDVWENEPAIDRELLGLVDFGTPHIAGYSADGKANGTSAAVRAVAEVLDLPLKEFSVAELPAPDGVSADFVVDASGKDNQDVLAEAVLHTYNIGEDSARLKDSPGGFEMQRDTYRTRREPCAFAISVKNASNAMKTSLELLGFKVSTIL